MNLAIVAHNGLWELTPLTLFTMLTLLALTLCMTTLFYYDCLGHQKLENIAHIGSGGFIEFVWRDGMGLILPLRLL